MSNVGKILQGVQGLGQGVKQSSAISQTTTASTVHKRTDATQAAIQGHNEVVVGKTSTKENQDKTKSASETTQKAQNKSASERALDAAWKGKYYDVTSTDGSRADVLKEPNLANKLNYSTTGGNLLGGHTAPPATFAGQNLIQPTSSPDSAQIGAGGFASGSNGSIGGTSTEGIGNQVAHVDHHHHPSPVTKPDCCNHDSQSDSGAGNTPGHSVASANEPNQPEQPNPEQPKEEPTEYGAENSGATMNA